MSETIREKLNRIDHKCLDESLRFHDLRSLFEATAPRLSPQDKEEIKKVIQNTDDAETIAAVLQAKAMDDKNESLEEKLVDAPQEVIDELLEILESYGFILDSTFEENPAKTMIMGDVHIQVINPDSFIEDSGEIDVQSELSKYVTQDLIDEIHELDQESNCPITWNFGINNDGQVTGGLDIMKQWVEESLQERVNPRVKGYFEPAYSERYSVRAYYDDNYRGLADSFSSDDFDEIRDKAHEFLSDGSCITVNDYETGKFFTLTPDEYFYGFEGEGIQSYMFDESFNEDLEESFKDRIVKKTEKYCIAKDSLNGKKIVYSLWLKSNSPRESERWSPTTAYFNTIEDAENYYNRKYLDESFKRKLKESVDDVSYALDNAFKYKEPLLIETPPDTAIHKKINAWCAEHGLGVVTYTDTKPVKEVSSNKALIIPEYDRLDDQTRFKTLSLMDKAGLVVATVSSRSNLDPAERGMFYIVNLLVNESLNEDWSDDFEYTIKSTLSDKGFDDKHGYSFDFITNRDGNLEAQLSDGLDWKDYELIKKAFRNTGIDVYQGKEHKDGGLLSIVFETESLKEDTIKQNGKWVNKGKEGTHGKFRTKKAADAQRKAMFANGYKGESLNEAYEAPYFKAYITNLGKYNEGELIGDWVEFPIDEDDFTQVLESIGIGDTDDFGAPYEEWFVSDYECNLPGFDWQELGEYPSYEALQEYGELVKSIDDLEAVSNALEVTGNLQDAIDGIDNGSIMFYRGVNDNSDLGYMWVDEVYGGAENLDKDTLERYFDYEQLGRDLSFDSYENDEGEDISAGEYWCGDENASDYDIGVAFVEDVGIDGVSDISSYFDYEQFGRDLTFDGFTFTSDGCVLQESLKKNGKLLKEDYQHKDDEWGSPYTYKEVERELKDITNDFTDKDGNIRCYWEQEKEYGKQILKDHYDIIEVSDGRTGKGEDMSWVISYANPKIDMEKEYQRGDK